MTDCHWPDLVDAEFSVKLWARNIKADVAATEEGRVAMIKDPNRRIYVNVAKRTPDGAADRPRPWSFLFGGRYKEVQPVDVHTTRCAATAHSKAAGLEKLNMGLLQSVSSDFAQYMLDSQRKIINMCVAKGYMDSVEDGKVVPVIKNAYFKVECGIREEERAVATASGEPDPGPMDHYEFLIKNKKLVSIMKPMLANKEVVGGKYVMSTALKMRDTWYEEAGDEIKASKEPNVTKLAEMSPDKVTRRDSPDFIQRGMPVFGSMVVDKIVPPKDGGPWRFMTSFPIVLVMSLDCELSKQCAAFNGDSGGVAGGGGAGGDLDSTMAAFGFDVTSQTIDAAPGSPKKRAREGPVSHSLQSAAKLGRGGAAADGEEAQEALYPDDEEDEGDVYDA
jgi:hypothetical protein